MAGDCKDKPDNEFGFVRFFGLGPSGNLKISRNRQFKAVERSPMFAIDRSALAVVVPLALLLAVVAWSNRPLGDVPHPAPSASEGQQAPEGAQTVAANFPSR
jgi:hypothetical protein